jgi:hypothetical protein
VKIGKEGGHFHKLYNSVSVEAARLDIGARGFVIFYKLRITFNANNTESDEGPAGSVASRWPNGLKVSLERDAGALVRQKHRAQNET